MNVLILSPYPFKIISSIQREGDRYIIYNEKLNIGLLNKRSIDYIVSYGYKYIINKEIVAYMKGKIINLHISYLPFNRGFYTNLWSHIEWTPSGISIHRIDEDIDTGSISFRKPIEIINKNHTFESSHTILRNEVENLFNEKWKEIKNNNYMILCPESIGSYHSKSQVYKVLSFLELVCKTNILEAIEIIKNKKNYFFLNSLTAKI